MGLNMGEGDGTAGTCKLADERDGHQQTDTRLEGEDTTLERALRAGHSSATHDPPSVTSPGHGRQLIMTITRIEGHRMM